MIDWSQIKKFYHTVKYLKPSQIYYQLYYRLRSRLRLWTGFQYRQLSKPSNPQWLNLVEPIAAHAYYHGGNYFIFLNQRKQFTDRIDWNFDAFGKLWTYYLNYFDYLNQPDMSAQQGLCLMHAFVDDIGSIQDGLEPYPISLRGINWIKFLLRHQIQDQRLSDSLYAQYDILLDNLEYHILGNHLLENGFSLLFGGAYFQDNKLFDKGMQIVSTQIDEQILADGGHFERSPMYHCIILERMLDVLNLFQSMNDHAYSSFPLSTSSFPRRRESSLSNNGDSHSINSGSRIPSETTARSQPGHLEWSGEFQDDRRAEFNSQFLWHEQLHKMLKWLQVMQRPDGTLAHFNDTAQGVASEVDEIFDYAHRLGVQCSGYWGANIRSERLDSLLDSRLRGNDGVERGNEGEESGNEGEESGNEGEESGNEGEESGNEGEESGNEGEESGNDDEESGNDVEESGNDSEKSENEEVENDSINEDSKNLIHLPESGYVKLRHNQAELIADVGKVGPDYIPGHAHADTLSFEFYYAGQPIIVNTGTSCYGYSERRAFERSSSAHNCLVVDGYDSSEVWSGFRVARRAYPFDLQMKADNRQVTCAHDGYKRLKNPVVHRRSWQLKDEGLEITDWVEGDCDSVELYFYLYPGLVWHKTQASKYFIVFEGKKLLKVAFNQSVKSAKILAFQYAQCFGQLNEGQLLKLKMDTKKIVTSLYWS